jgi:putative peptide zinc metalloprotease protein
MASVRTSAPPDVWDAVSRSVKRTRRRKRGGLWDRLDELVDVTEFRPKLARDIELKEFKLRWGNDYAVIANPRDLLHFRLEPGDVELVKLMDGTRTVKEIVVERFEDSGDLELSGVADLVEDLKAGNFLHRPFVDVYGAVERAVAPRGTIRTKIREFLSTLSIQWDGADRFVRWLHEHGLRHFFRPGTLLLAGLVSLAGLGAFILLVLSGRFSISGESLALASLILIVLNYFLTFVHELGHAVTLVHYGRRIKGAGFLIYFGSPSFFVEASDGVMLERRERILQAFAGPYAESIVAGIAAGIAWAFPEAPFAQLLYTFAAINYFVLFMNLIPLLELDGYWILSDLIQVPDLRPRSLSFISHDLWHKLRSRERFSIQEVGLASYGILGVAFTIFSFYTAYYFWEAIFGSLISRLWNGGTGTRVLLVVLALVIAGPAVRGLITLVRSFLRRLKALWRRVRFRLERGWRVEAAELIDALPLFEDVPVDALNELAGRVRLRTLRRGQPVVRQGERADAFYVVRRGTLIVVEENRETGNERILRTLGRGESFGEFGLIKGGPRSATVRAVEEADVFEIDRGTFERLLADMIHVPEFAPTLQAIEELRAIPCFSHLEPDEVAELLTYGEWVSVGPGKTIIKQGDVGDAFYAIASGRLDVKRNGKVTATLGAGDYFGEVALLRDVRRTASVRTRTPARLFRLGRKGFGRLMGSAFKRGTLRPHIAVGRAQRH